GRHRIAEVGRLRRAAAQPLPVEQIAVVRGAVLQLQLRLERRRRHRAAGAGALGAAAERVARLAERTRLHGAAAADARRARLARRARVAVVAADARGDERAARRAARARLTVRGTGVARLGVARTRIDDAVAAEALDRHRHEVA